MEPTLIIANSAFVWHALSDGPPLSCTSGSLPLVPFARSAPMSPVPWQQVLLVFASDPSNTSAWERDAGGALERVGVSERRSRDVSLEHLRALQELCEHGACANWLATAPPSDRALRREDVDWTGFALEQARVLLRVGDSVLWTKDDGDVEAEVAGLPRVGTGGTSSSDRATVHVAVRVNGAEFSARAQDLLPTH